MSRFIWLNFCGSVWNTKRVSIMADELETTFENGVSFDAHAVLGFKDDAQSDLFCFSRSFNFNDYASGVPDRAGLSVFLRHQKT